MKNLICIIIILLSLSGLCPFSSAQTSIGFTDKSNISPILSYRLPAWGYSTIFLDINGRLISGGNQASNHYAAHYPREVSKRDYFDGGINLSPVIDSYYESEQLIRKYRLTASLSNQFLRNDGEWSDETPKRRNDYSSNFAFTGNLQRYVQKNIFLQLKGSAIGNYRNLSEKSAYRQNKTEHKEFFKIELNPGIGFGRIRNVTPVLRALRLQERCKALQSKLAIADDEVQMVAQEIAKISGYEVIYQREARYFWQNVLKQAENMTTVTPFEVHYLTDILKESIGARFEGWNIAVGLQTAKPDSEKWTIGGFSEANWYKNLSLEQQTHLSLYGTYLKYPNAKYSVTEEVQFGMRINYLWLLTDRIYWRSSLGSHLISGKNKNKLSVLENFNNLTSNLAFYIENGYWFNVNLYLNLGKEKKKYDIEPESTFSYRSSELTFGFTYYFDRRLF